MRAESRSRRLDATFLPSEVTKSFLRTHSARPRVDVKSATIGSKRTVDIEVGCSFLASARLGSMSACGTNRTWRDVRLESAFGGRADVICSERVFPVLTQLGSRQYATLHREKVL